MNSEEIKQKINELETTIRDLTTRLDSVSNRTITSSDIINRDLDNKSKDIIQQVIEERLLDINWNNYFTFSTFFESLDGWDDLSSAGSTVAISGDMVQLTTDAATNDDAEVFKRVFIAEDFSFANDQRYKTSIRFDSVSDIDCLAVVGDRLPGTTYGVSYYGFHVVNNSLKGISVFDSNTTEVVLQTVAANTIYELEARLSKNRLTFYVNGVEKGLITGTNVVGDIIGQTTDDRLSFTFRVATAANTAKEMDVSYLNFVMKKRK